MNPLPTMIEFVGITSRAIHVNNHTPQSVISHAMLEHQTHETSIEPTCEDVMGLTNLWDNTSIHGRSQHVLASTSLVARHHYCGHVEDAPKNMCGQSLGFHIRIWNLG